MNPVTPLSAPGAEHHPSATSMPSAKEKEIAVSAGKDVAGTASSNTSSSKDASNNSMASLRLIIALTVVLPAAVFTVAHAVFLYQWKGGRVIEWLVQHPEIPICLAFMYVTFVFISPKFIDEKLTGFFANSEVLKCFLTIWNLFFSVFSCLGFFYSLPFLHKMVLGRPIQGLAMKKNRVTGVLEPAPTNMNGSLMTSLCYWNANVFQDGMAAFWLLAFDLSKIVEMMDTVFLILKGKKVLFLHWYHHLTVMLFCWHAHVTYISNGLWFAVMNMGIHTIMYFYYFCFSCGLSKLVKPFAQFITFLQIVQMVAGLVLQVCTLYYYIRLRWENSVLNNGANCDTNALSLLFGLIMYGSYFVLFIAFFVRAYGKKKEGRGSESRRARDGTASASNSSSKRAGMASSSSHGSISASAAPSATARDKEAEQQRVVVLQEEQQ